MKVLFDCLLDEAEMAAAIAAAREWASPYSGASPGAGATTLRDMLCRPLLRWLQAIHERKRPRTAAVDAAEELLRVADDMAYRLDRRMPVWPERVDILQALWTEFQRAAGHDAITELSAFRDNKRGPSAFYELVRTILVQHGKKTPAKKVWMLLRGFVGEGVVDEITDEAAWIVGKEDPIKYRSFETRLGQIRKTVE